MNANTRAYIEINIAVILFGFTAILGDLISVSAIALVGWRVVLAAAAYLLLIRWNRFREIPRRVKRHCVFIGFIVAFHWLCFYGAIKLSNVSLTLVCMATASFFTALVEPLLNRRDINWNEIALALIIVPAMALIVDGLDPDMMSGLWVGLLAAFSAAVFASWNKVVVNKAHPVDISFIEMSSASLIILIAMPVVYKQVQAFQWMPQGIDWIYLLILVLLCTNLAFLMTVRVLKELTAFESNLIINLEPVYGILLAWIILNEHEEMNAKFYIGAAVIILVILLNRVLRRRRNRSTSSPS